MKETIRFISSRNKQMKSYLIALLYSPLPDWLSPHTIGVGLAPLAALKGDLGDLLTVTPLALLESPAAAKLAAIVLWRVLLDGDASASRFSSSTSSSTSSLAASSVTSTVSTASSSPDAKVTGSSTRFSPSELTPAEKRSDKIIIHTRLLRD